LEQLKKCLVTREVEGSQESFTRRDEITDTEAGEENI